MPEIPADTGGVQLYTSVDEYRRVADPIFADREAEHSVMLGVLGNLEKDINHYNVTPQLLAITGSTSAVLLASMVHPYPLALSLPARDASDDDVEQALKVLADYVGTVLKEKQVFPVKIFGHPQLTDSLVKHLDNVTQHGFKRGIGLQVYHLEPRCLLEPRLKMSDDGSLWARRYVPEDAGWIRKWMHQFNLDIFGAAHERIVEDQLSELAKLPKESRGMFLLFKGEDFVSYAGYGGATANTIRVTNVFTATDFRGQGYGQLICWYVCRYLLMPDGLGKSCAVICADRSNSSAMGIYKGIGFTELTEGQEYVDHQALAAATKV